MAKHKLDALPDGLADAVAKVTKTPISDFGFGRQRKKGIGLSARQVMVGVLFYDYGWRISQITDACWQGTDASQAVIDANVALAGCEANDPRRQEVKELLSLP